MKKNNQYTVTVDYNQTVEQAVKAGSYDRAESCINSKSFPDSKAKQGIESTQQKSKVTTQIALIDIPFPYGRSYITTKEAKNSLGNMGYRPANLYELLALGAKHQKLQLTNWIVGLGSSLSDPDGDRYAPYLGRFGSGRNLVLYWFDDGWFGSWRFASVRK